MPNWVYNTLTIQGPKEQVDYIKDKLNSPYTRHYKDSWNAKTGKFEEQDITYSRPVFSFWNIIKPTDLDAYVEQPDHSLSISDAMKFQTNDWYSFNNREWGTKWDVAVHDDEKYPETELIEHKSDGEDQWLVYKFNTAWAPPTPAMEKLSALVPNCVLTLEYQEEQGWGGETEFVNGQITMESSYDDKCYDCDAINTMEYCEECENNVCSACGFGNEEDNNCETHKIGVDV